MSKAEKALKRLQSRPKDFTWDELVAVMNTLGYELKKAGGSARKFIHATTKATLMMHEPHPSNVLKTYQIAAAIRLLRQENQL